MVTCVCVTGGRHMDRSRSSSTIRLGLTGRHANTAGHARGSFVRAAARGGLCSMAQPAMVPSLPVEQVESKTSCS